jgi:hypothetical protein
MRLMFAGLALIALFALPATSGLVDAKGCIKGAVVGGVGGHFLHHPVMGALAGCAIGHHEAVKRDRALKAAAAQKPPVQHAH